MMKDNHFVCLYLTNEAEKLPNKDILSRGNFRDCFLIRQMIRNPEEYRIFYIDAKLNYAKSPYKCSDEIIKEYVKRKDKKPTYIEHVTYKLIADKDIPLFDHNFYREKV